MIYELALVSDSSLSEDERTKLIEIVGEVLKEKGGEIMVADDWGTKALAQPSKVGEIRGYFNYFIFKADDNTTNPELQRRFKINEGVMRSLICLLGENDEADKVLKGLKIPYSSKYKGSVTENKEEEEEGENFDKERKRFAKKRGCWFTAKGIRADWKDPATFSWLINEFGKISPARVSGITRKHQRWANTAIKRARQIGIASYISNKFAE